LICFRPAARLRGPLAGRCCSLRSVTSVSRDDVNRGWPHRPGELGRAASRLGEKQINIDYSYSGLEPHSTLALAVFGVDNLTKAAAVLDELSGRTGVGSNLLVHVRRPRRLKPLKGRTGVDCFRYLSRRGTPWR